MIQSWFHYIAGPGNGSTREPENDRNPLFSLCFRASSIPEGGLFLSHVRARAARPEKSEYRTRAREARPGFPL